ncbi:MAG: glutaminase [Elainellaceae cyanobacterium]
MKPLAALSLAELTQWSEQAKAQTQQGQVARRIPGLATAAPDWFAVQVSCQSETFYAWGDRDRAFPLMSAVKPFLVLYLLEQFGAETVFQWVRMEPSAAPFNSLEQLIADSGRPRNPMINSGAITLCEKLPGKDAYDRCQRLCGWLNQKSGSNFQLDEKMLASVRQAGREPNQALVSYLSERGQVREPEVTLDVYEQVCCLTGWVADLARLGELLAIDRPEIMPVHRRAVNFLMLTCGLYEASANYALRIGLPMKSGISGALLAVVPQQGAIACYSPALDAIGNPVAGLAFVEQLAQALQLNLFG